MSKKLSKNLEYYEGYYMLAIVSYLKDYSLCYHINNELKLDLVKYEDLVFDIDIVENCIFSWYHFEDKTSGTVYCLVGNKGDNGILIPSQKTVDFFLIIKNPANNELIKSMASRLRKISEITAVFDINMQQTKDMDLLLETIELHELEYVRRRSGK